MNDRPRTAEDVLAGYKLLEPFPVTAELLGILRRMLDVHSDDGRGWCQGCGFHPDHQAWLTRTEDCRTRAACLAAEADMQFAASPASQGAPMSSPDAGPRLVVVEWEDSTNIQEWTPIGELGEWAADGGWRVRNVGYLVYEDDECVVLAARLAEHAEPPQAGLYERIPKRAIIDRWPAQVPERRIRPTGYRPAGKRRDGGEDGRQATEGQTH